VVFGSEVKSSSIVIVIYVRESIGQDLQCSSVQRTKEYTLVLDAISFARLADDSINGL
jgi:hypothetical protein